MPNITNLQTTALPCGTKFIIGTDIKDSTFQPGSIGYLSFVLGSDCECPNIMYYNTVIVRRGNKGKLRIEQNMLLAPIFKLPGVPIDFLIPHNAERKYFVDIQPFILNTENLTNVGNGGGLSPEELSERQFSFLGFSLAKGLFLQELDSTTKSIDHPLMKKLNIGENSKQKLFSSKKKSVLSHLIDNIESLVKDGRIDTINENFWYPAVQSALIKEIRNFEVALTLPMLEYSRKVNNVQTSAIEYIIKQLESDDGKSLPNQKLLLDLATSTWKNIKEIDTQLTYKIEQRLSHIIHNRELVNDEVSFIGKLKTTSYKKATHVFSSY